MYLVMYRPNDLVSVVFFLPLFFFSFFFLLRVATVTVLMILLLLTTFQMLCLGAGALPLWPRLIEFSSAIEMFTLLLSASFIAASPIKLEGSCSCLFIIVGAVTPSC